MQAADIVGLIVDAFDTGGIKYMLVGSFSSNVYGVARATQDADFVIELSDANAAQLSALLGPSFRVDPQLSFETITGTSRLQGRHLPSGFDVEFFLLPSDEYQQMRFSRRRAQTMHDRRVMLPSAEDVIVQKLRWYSLKSRPKDLLDAVNVLAVQFGRLDLDYIRQWADRHGSRQLFERLLKDAETAQ
jgi:hypothetical protein